MCTSPDHQECTAKVAPTFSVAFFPSASRILVKNRSPPSSVKVAVPPYYLEGPSNTPHHDASRSIELSKTRLQPTVEFISPSFLVSGSLALGFIRIIRLPVNRPGFYGSSPKLSQALGKLHPVRGFLCPYCLRGRPAAFCVLQRPRLKTSD